ncbi:MAG: methyltransferase domain-containing protein [Rhodobacter sp.]|nr:methyltransferase domain-containing protein [Paracoccaceae bacterium]MCC0073869.1 methyltransferase domain-containing protein [Rhodobacter sp.]
MPGPCLLCGGSDRAVHATRDAKDGQPLDIAVCATCGMVQLDTVPDDAALSAFYASEYRAAYRGSAVPKLRNVHKAGGKAAGRLAPVLPLTRRGARLLDIGAGGGEFVFLAQEAGLTARGIDPNGDYVDYARTHLGIDLSRAEVSDLAPSDRFDVITLFHVLEHLAHPRAVFAQIAGLLNDDGLLVIEVPNFGSALLPPRNTFFKAHINYFTEPTLRMLGSEHFTVDLARSTKDLYMIFRKRAAAAEQDTAPRAEARRIADERFAKRGLPEYLAQGGGLSVFRKLAQQWATRKAIKGADPRAVLMRFAGQRAGA